MLATKDLIIDCHLVEGLPCKEGTRNTLSLQYRNGIRALSSSCNVTVRMNQPLGSFGTPIYPVPFRFDPVVLVWAAAADFNFESQCFPRHASPPGQNLNYVVV